MPAPLWPFFLCSSDNHIVCCIRTFIRTPWWSFIQIATLGSAYPVSLVVCQVTRPTYKSTVRMRNSRWPFGISTDLPRYLQTLVTNPIAVWRRTSANPSWIPINSGFRASAHHPPFKLPIHRHRYQALHEIVSASQSAELSFRPTAQAFIHELRPNFSCSLPTRRPF